MSDKNRKEMSKKAKTIAKVSIGSVFGIIGIVTIIVLAMSAGTKTVTDGVKHIHMVKYINSRPIKINIIEVNNKINPNLEITCPR